MKKHLLLALTTGLISTAGNSGDHVEYDVVSVEGCVLDPIIIIN